MSSRIIIFLVLFSIIDVVAQNYVENYEDMMNAVLSNDIQVQDNTVDEQKSRPMSIMSGEIPEDVIKKLADYLFSLLQGTGNVKKRTPSITTTTTNPTTVMFLPFRKPSMAVTGFAQRKRSRRLGISRRKNANNLYGSRKLKNGKI